MSGRVTPQCVDGYRRRVCPVRFPCIGSGTVKHALRQTVNMERIDQPLTSLDRQAGIRPDRCVPDSTT